MSDWAEKTAIRESKWSGAEHRDNFEFTLRVMAKKAKNNLSKARGKIGKISKIEI